MEKIIIYSIVLLATFFILKKIFKKGGGCGCSDEENCSKK
ncbi:MAG: FeoB-associated Cys-rich membrane protein [Arcobacter sp.]